MSRTTSILAFLVVTTAMLLGAGSAAAKGPPPIKPPLVTVATSLSENPATAGDMVTVGARATIRATGADVPSSPGELVLQACLDASTFTTYVAAANCTGSAPTGVWEDLNLLDETPPSVSFAWDTTGEAGQTIGFRAVYHPKGSGYAGGPSQPVDLVVNAPKPPPPPPPPPPPGNCDPGGIYTGTIHDAAHSFDNPLTLAVWHINCGANPPVSQTYISGNCAAFPCQTISWLIFLDTTTWSTFTGTIPATVCSVPGVCPTLISGTVGNGVLHFQYEPGQDDYFDGTRVSGT